jgi:hypothetical protein
MSAGSAAVHSPHHVARLHVASPAGNMQQVPYGMVNFPECEKLAVIAPILKKPGLDPDAAASYRPISNLTFLSKLIERVVSCRLKTYLRDHQLLVPQQSAYREHHSTETATLKVASDVFNAADTGRVTILALLDLSAAFDTVDHDILVRRLETTYGIGGAVLRWMCSFLSGQSQVVHFAGQQSAQLPLTCGVPPGISFRPHIIHLVHGQCGANSSIVWS